MSSTVIHAPGRASGSHVAAKWLHAVLGAPAAGAELLHKFRTFHSLQREAHFCETDRPQHAHLLRGRARRLVTL